jgi:hypothetical protein
MAKFQWDERTGRYRGSGGRFLSGTQVREALDGAINSAESRIRSVSNQLREGKINVSEWELRMRENVKNMQLYSGAAAKGGWAQLTPADLGRIGSEVKQQYGYLSRFGAQIRNGEVDLDGRFMSRVELYCESARTTYHSIEQREKELRGFTEYRNILNPADHCDECIDATAQGWVPIGELPDIGDRICRARCKCEFEYR